MAIDDIEPGDSFQTRMRKAKAEQQPERPKPTHLPVPPTVDMDDPRDVKWASTALRAEVDRVLRSVEGERNHNLNTAGFSAYQVALGGYYTKDQVTDALTDAARSVGLSDSEIETCLGSGWKGALKKGPRYRPTDNDKPLVTEFEYTAPQGGQEQPGAPETSSARQITLRPFTDIVSDVPDWVWQYGGRGRIQLGTLCLFAGRPAAGKSTAARWFAAQFTLGEVEGIWQGRPQNVAYLSLEESNEDMVKPSLQAAGADMSKIMHIKVEENGAESTLMSIRDEQNLTAELIDNKIRVVIVDPIMSTLGATVDINKNNEVRQYIQPYARIAQAIDGVVIGVVHLNKQAAKDVVAGINGSSAFGEIARSVFGFTKNDGSDDGDRVMSQSKNSAGSEDLALTYQLEPVSVLTDSGRVGEMTRFLITGESEVRVEDVMSDGGLHTKRNACEMWLSDYLEQESPCPRQQVVKAGTAEGYSESTLSRAAKRLGVVYETRSFNGAPRTTAWALPSHPHGSDFSEPSRSDIA